MAANNTTGFISLLPNFLTRANISQDAPAAYYSFYPVSGQSGFTFVFNDLYPTGQMFLQTVLSGFITNVGSGYGASEVPNVTFIPKDGGTGAAATVTIASGTNILQGLVRAFPMNDTGINLIPQGNFLSGATGWLDFSGNAVSGSVTNRYAFESGLLHFSSTGTNPFTTTLKPSGFGVITGACWLVGSLDVSGITSSSTLTWDIRNLSGFNWGNITGAQIMYGPVFINSGFSTYYFGGYLTTGSVFSFEMVIGTKSIHSSFNVTFDNLKLWTGKFDNEKIHNNQLIQCSVNGCTYEGITLTNNTTGFPPFIVGNGVSGAGLIDYHDVNQLNDNQRGYANINLGGDWAYFTVGFWHYFYSNAVLPDILLLADWPNSRLQIQNGFYNLYFPDSNTTVNTNVNITSGWHYIVAGASPASGSNVFIAFLSVDGQGFSTSVNSLLSTQTNPTFHLYGTSDYTAYEVGFDEISIWNRTLADFEISELATSGNIYPYSNITGNNYGYISGITITSGGMNFTIAPDIIIDPPTGGGTAGMGYVTLTNSTGLIYAGNLPAFSVGSTNNILNTLASGTGTFAAGNNDLLRVGNALIFDSWTIFLNFTQTGHISGVSQVLISSMTGINQQSGFLVGLNDSNRLFFEYIDSTYSLGGARRVITHSQELSTYNLISISKDSENDNIVISNHNLAKGDSFGITYPINGFIDSNFLYLGGFPNTTHNTSYTGFIGKMTDVLLITGATTTSQVSGLAPIFFSTGYNAASQMPVYLPFVAVTGASFSSGILTSGVTGYTIQVVNIPNSNGNPTGSYDIVPLTGIISGDTIVYQTGLVSGTSITYSGIDEGFFFYNPYLRSYNDSVLVMLSYSITTGDILEVYSFTDRQIDKISIVPQAYSLYDFYLSENYGGSTNVNVYNDGLLQLPNIDYVLQSGKIISNNLSQFQSFYNYLLYDEITGNTATLNFSGYSGAFTLTGNLTQSGMNDVYLNGQKLVSGFDYSVNGGWDIVFVGTEFGQPVVWASGTFGFAPARTGNRFVFLSSGLGYTHDFSSVFSGGVMDEMVFLNGQRLAPGIDYIVSPSGSLLNSNNRLTGLTFPVYTGDIFDTQTLTTKPAIT